MTRVPDLGTEVAREFWAAAEEERWILPRCEGCGRLRWYLQPVCPRCQTAAYAWDTMSGRGTVYTFTVVHRAFDEAFAGDVPYVSALVTPEEDEDVRFVTRVVDVAPADVRVGMDVQVRFVTEGSVTVPLFVPRESA
jgi:uncharacterized OB-fold protein